MRTFIKKHWAVIIFIITALIDTNQGFLESLFDKQWQIVLIRIIGSLILAYKWNPSISIYSDINAITDPIRSGGPKKRF